MDSPWTRRDAAEQNASDTCVELGLHAGTDAWEFQYAETYRITLAMLIDEGLQGYTPECEECERQQWPLNCFRCFTRMERR